MLLTGSPRRLIWRHASQHLLNASLDWTSSTDKGTKTTSLEFDYRVVCTGNYHGPRCAVFCRPRDDANGHYGCTQNGTRVCLDGWSGTYCNQRKLPNYSRGNMLATLLCQASSLKGNRKQKILFQNKMLMQ